MLNARFDPAPHRISVFSAKDWGRRDLRFVFAAFVGMCLAPGAKAQDGPQTDLEDEPPMEPAIIYWIF